MPPVLLLKDHASAVVLNRRALASYVRTTHSGESQRTSPQ